jgi:hypothetical protein
VELKWTKTLESTIATKVMSTTFAQKGVKGFLSRNPENTLNRKKCMYVFFNINN